MVSFPLSVPAAAELELLPALELLPELGVPALELLELPPELQPATTAVAATDKAAKRHALGLLISIPFLL